MILQPSFSVTEIQSTPTSTTAPNSLSSTSTSTRLAYSPSPSACRFFSAPGRGLHPHYSLIIKCRSSSNSYSHSNSNSNSKVYRSRPNLTLKCDGIYKRITNPPVQAEAEAEPDWWVASVLDQREKRGKKVSNWELSKVARELRKSRRYNLALQVYEWMNNRMERLWLSGSDAPIQLDLIAKVRGVSSAEDYFVRIPDTLKDNRIYGALLSAYVGAGARDKADALMVQMRNKGYANHPLYFNVMMTLYMKLKEYDKVDELVSEMRGKGIQLDLYSYNIWLSSRGSQGSAQGMEYVFEQLCLDSTVLPNWTTFSAMAAFYIKFGQVEKAEQSLKYLESRISSGWDRMPYHDLITQYGSLGNKQEVYRVWSMYKSTFPSIPNWGYHAVISTLTRLGDIEGAEEIYRKWLSVKRRYDPRIGNLVMSWYAKEGCFDKVKGFFGHMVKIGGKPNSASWAILGETHIKEGKIFAALSCFKVAVSTNVYDKWKPKPSNISSFLELCEKEADTGSKEIFVGLLRELGCFEDGRYESVLVEKCSGEVGNGYGGVEQFMPPDDIDTPGGASAAANENEANSLLFE